MKHVVALSGLKRQRHRFLRELYLTLCFLLSLEFREAHIEPEGQTGLRHNVCFSKKTDDTAVFHLRSGRS